MKKKCVHWDPSPQDVIVGQMAKERKLHFSKSALFHIDHLSEDLLRHYILYQNCLLRIIVCFGGLMAVIPKCLQARLSIENQKDNLDIIKTKCCGIKFVLVAKPSLSY